MTRLCEVGMKNPRTRQALFDNNARVNRSFVIDVIQLLNNNSSIIESAMFKQGEVMSSIMTQIMHGNSNQVSNNSRNTYRSSTFILLRTNTNPTFKVLLTSILSFLIVLGPLCG